MSFSVSVVIPAYGRASLLSEAIASLQRQTVPPLEIIVVDDGSVPPIETPAVPGPVPVSMIRLPENRGGGVARNAGIDAAKGDFIALLDSDDWWEAERVERLQAALHARDLDERVLFFDNLNVAKRRSRSYPAEIAPSQMLGDEMVFGRILIQTSSLVFHRKWRDVLRFDGRLRKHQDWDFVLEAQRNGFVLVNSATNMVVLRPGFFRMRVTHATASESSRLFLEKHGPGLGERARRRFFAQTIKPFTSGGLRGLKGVIVDYLRRDLGLRAVVTFALRALRR